MVKTELIKRSPLRILEKSIHGGVGEGNIGIITSTRGGGKTACLVHIAIDKLFQSKHVIHLSFSEKTDHIIDWYETLFQEITEKHNLEDAKEIHDLVIKNRVIMNFNQNGIPITQVIRSMKSLIDDGNFRAEVLAIDGYNFSTGTVDTLEALRTFAQSNNITIWATTDIAGVHNTQQIPTELLPFIDEIAVLINLHNKEDHIELTLIKDHDRYIDEDLHLKLEPGTLLIS